ncbi:hypothetical protein ACFSQT_16145 [Mesorhizobium calcicola]|uniref:Uncharacterized protein n=1 Tax=Mesorhizobium calcicola TaxID=1300310 RepID=A0ABW4WD43_9HYPH
MSPAISPAMQTLALESWSCCSRTMTASSACSISTALAGRFDKGLTSRIETLAAIYAAASSLED